MKRNRTLLIALAISLLVHLLGIVGPGWYVPSLGDWVEPAVSPVIEARLVSPPPAGKRKAAAKAKPQPKKRKPAIAPATPKMPEAVVAQPPSAQPPSPVDVPKPVPDEPVDVAEPPPEVAPESVAAADEPSAAPDQPPKLSPGDTGPGSADAPADASPDAPAGEGDATAATSLLGMPTGLPLPNRVRIVYRVDYGDNGFTVGRAIQELRIKGRVYAMRSTAETTGMAAWFRPGRIVTESGGEVIDGNLRPRELVVERKGKTETAVFQWESATVVMPSGQTIALPDRTQDMLSMFAQLALMSLDQPKVTLPVLTSKVVEPYEFEVLGKEMVETGWGEREAMHLRNVQPNGVERTDVWLGVADARLPIRIRITDRHGDTFVQTADKMEFEEEGAR